MRWIWDRDKDQVNRSKHGLSLAAGAVVLDHDPQALSLPDPHPDGDRWKTVGNAGGIVVLVVIHTEAAPDGTGRIISVRKATRQERRAYEDDT